MAETYLQLMAKSILEHSDITVIRHVSVGQKLPDDIIAWRASLRDIANGTDITSTTIPIQPTDYVDGT